MLFHIEFVGVKTNLFPPLLTSAAFSRCIHTGAASEAFIYDCFLISSLKMSFCTEEHFNERGLLFSVISRLSLYLVTYSSKTPDPCHVILLYTATPLPCSATSGHIFDKFQSGFRSRHTNKTALIKVTNDLLLIADSGF